MLGTGRNWPACSREPKLVRGERDVSLKFDHVVRSSELLKNPPDLRVWIIVLIFRLPVSIILLAIMW